MSLSLHALLSILIDSTEKGTPGACHAWLASFFPSEQTAQLQSKTSQVKRKLHVSSQYKPVSKKQSVS